jgi:pimeloyl-ACP methyl ester carboxylesterase
MLTFVPPDPPYYQLRKKEEDGEELFEWLVDVQMMQTQFPDVRIYIMKTQRGNFIPGFLFRHPSGNAPLTIIFSHGNAADCGVMRERKYRSGTKGSEAFAEGLSANFACCCCGLRSEYIQLVLRCRVNVFAYDYSGYGESTGTPSEADTYADICAAYDFLVDNQICVNAAEEIVLYGQSVGSGPSCKLASSKKRPIKGMILHSPILSGIRVLVDNRGPLACCDIYPNIKRIRKVTAPVLVIHGDRDEEVGFHHGQRLHDRVPDKYKRDPCWISGAGHNDIVEAFPDQYYPRVARYLRELEADEHAEREVTEVTIGGKQSAKEAKASAGEGGGEGGEDMSQTASTDPLLKKTGGQSERGDEGQDTIQDSQVVLT